MDPAVEKMVKNLEAKTGKTLEHWIGLVEKSNLEKHGEIVKMLKSEHGMGHGYANMVVHMAKKSAAFTSENTDLVSEQYKGREHLHPIYEKLHNEIEKFGNDVDVVPKKKSVSFRTKRQFCLVQPTTKSRIDLGLKYNDKPHEGRLETSGPFGTMCSHRVRITEISQVDDELISLIREAYEESR